MLLRGTLDGGGVGGGAGFAEYSLVSHKNARTTDRRNPKKHEVKFELRSFRLPHGWFTPNFQLQEFYGSYDTLLTIWGDHDLLLRRIWSEEGLDETPSQARPSKQKQL